jgi:peroxiredoxin
MKHLILAAALWSAAFGALAQAPAHAAPRVEGPTVDGKPFQLASLKGKVVLLMFWSTECAVCRDKMAELRQNYQGWQGKPFELVLVATDRRMKDVDDYEAVISRMVPLQQRFVQLWAGAAGYQDNVGPRGTLPASLLIDKNGKVVERWQGRIPAEAWDKIAELL